jgi:hypothetical protein
MRLEWEALTALATVFSSLVILATVVYAAMQVRVGQRQAQGTQEQLEHLRRATQLDAMMWFKANPRPRASTGEPFSVELLR